MLLAVALPMIAGLLGVAVPAFSLSPWISLLDQPGVLFSAWYSFATGLAGAWLSLLLALAVVSGLERAGKLSPQALVAAALPLLLAVPHVTLALGLAEALGPSGWLARAASPWLTGWERPPFWPEAPGLNLAPLVLGLTLKETPFLLLAAAAALPQLGLDRQRCLTASLGYGAREAFLKVTAPRLWPHLKLPFLAVLVYGVTNVEMAAVLGPSLPPTLALRVLDWFLAPDLGRHAVAAAGAVALALTAGLAGAVSFAAVRLLGLATLGWRTSGPSPTPADGSTWPRSAALLLLSAWALALALLAVRSGALRWPFPLALPREWTLDVWGRHAAGLLQLSETTALIAFACACLAVLAAVIELETRRPFERRLATAWLFYLPLFLPQLAFLPGVQVLLLKLGAEGSVAAVAALHALFALPYAHLLLAQAWTGMDPRYALTARSLGRGPLSVLLRVKLPLLRGALFGALAVSFSVSVALYLPTLFAGAGRVSTLTTEALTLASGGDRRLAAATGVVLALLPVLAYALARIGAARGPRSGVSLG